MVGVLLGLAGCGFQLRESAQLSFETLYSALAPGSALGVEFARQVRGTKLVTDRATAAAALDMVEERRAKEVVSYSTSGRPREYRLLYIVGFKVTDTAGNELLPVTRITVRRYVTTSDVEQLSEELKEAFLYREMQEDMVQQMLRRLGAIKPAG
jgi:LPS-assembly lipoprotein